MRKFPRFRIHSDAFCSVIEKQHRILLQDYSRMGFGFLSEKDLRPHSFVTIAYQNETGQLVWMKSYVKHSRRIKENCFFIGVQFIGIESRSSSDQAG